LLRKLALVALLAAVVAAVVVLMPGTGKGGPAMPDFSIETPEGSGDLTYR